MRTEALICFRNQLFVKALFTGARFITRNQQYGATRGVERKSHAPDPIVGIETELFHIRVLRPFKGIDSRASELWPENLKKLGLGQHLQPHVL